MLIGALIPAPRAPTAWRSSKIVHELHNINSNKSLLIDCGRTSLIYIGSLSV